MWQAFVPASGAENGADGAAKEGRHSSKKRQRADLLPGDGQAVSSMYESIVRPGVSNRGARTTGTNHDEYDSHGNGDFTSIDNFNSNGNVNSNDHFKCNGIFNGNDNLSGNGNSNHNFNSNGNGEKNGRGRDRERDYRLSTERPPTSSTAGEEEHATSEWAEAAIFGPAPNPNPDREHGPNNNMEEEEEEKGEQEEEEGFFCRVCGERVKSLSEEKHNTSTLHIFNQQHRPADRKVQIDESNKGFQLLESMGWKLDEGLGARKQGRVNPLRTTFRQGKTGLGAGGKLRPRVTHFPSHVPSQALNAPDGKSDAVRAHESLDRRRRGGGGGGGGARGWGGLGGGLGGGGGGGGGSGGGGSGGGGDGASGGGDGETGARGGFWGQGVQHRSSRYAGGGADGVTHGGQNRGAAAATAASNAAAAASRKQQQQAGAGAGSGYFMSRKERKAREDAARRKERRTKLELFSDVPEEYAALFAGQD